MKGLTKILFLCSLLFITACGTGKDVNGEMDSEPEEIAEEVEEVEVESEELTEEVESDEVDWRDATEDVDFSEDNFDEIPWEDIHLSKAQFDDFLDEVKDIPFEANEDDETEIDLEVFDVDFDGKTIEFTISSVDDNFMDEFYRGMYIFMLDGFSRQFYLQSDYSNGEEHPVIIFYDEEGSVITENNDFIEMDLDEE